MLHLLGKKKCAEILIKAGANVNKGQPGAWKPLHAACTKCHFEIIKYLVDRGAKVDEPNSKEGGYTALHMCISHKKPELFIIRFLLDKGADINRPVQSTGQTPLHLAVFWNHFDIVQELVQRKAKLDLKNSKGRTPLQLAARFGYASIAEYLAKALKVPMPKLGHRERTEGGVVETPEAPPSPDDLDKLNDSSNARSQPNISSKKHSTNSPHLSHSSGTRKSPSHHKQKPKS